jgi:hypothetical protein
MNTDTHARARCKHTQARVHATHTHTRTHTHTHTHTHRPSPPLHPPTHTHTHTHTHTLKHCFTYYPLLRAFIQQTDHLSAGIPGLWIMQHQQFTSLALSWKTTRRGEIWVVSLWKRFSWRVNVGWIEGLCVLVLDWCLSGFFFFTNINIILIHRGLGHLRKTGQTEIKLQGYRCNHDCYGCVVLISNNYLP